MDWCRAAPRIRRHAVGAVAMARSTPRAVTPEGVTQHEAGAPPQIVLDEQGRPMAVGSMPAGCDTYAVVIDERHAPLGLAVGAEAVFSVSHVRPGTECRLRCPASCALSRGRHGRSQRPGHLTPHPDRRDGSQGRYAGHHGPAAPDPRNHTPSAPWRRWGHPVCTAHRWASTICTPTAHDTAANRTESQFSCRSINGAHLRRHGLRHSFMCSGLALGDQGVKGGAMHPEPEPSADFAWQCWVHVGGG